MVTKLIHDKLIYSRRMKRLTEILLSFIRSDCENILDLGCGDGKIDMYLMDQKENLNVRGIDVLVREQTYIPVTKYDGINIPRESNSVDTVMLIDVLHHTENPEMVMKEVTRVAEKNIIIKDHIKRGLISYIKLRMMDFVGNAHYHVSLPYNYLTKEEWDAVFKQNNLQVEKYDTDLHLYTGIFHYLFDRKLHFVVRLKISN